MKNGLFALLGLITLTLLLKLFSFSSAADDRDKAKTQEVCFVIPPGIPKDIGFAGEKMPTGQWDVKERLDRELLVNNYWQSQTVLLFKRSRRWFSVIEPILKNNHVPDDFKFLSLIESGFTNVVSPSGAAGFWQFLEATGKKYGLEINEEVDERYDVEKSTEAACHYLTEAYNEFGSWTLAAAAYNMGIEGVKRQIEKQKARSYYDLYLNDETSRYVFRILAVKEIFSHPQRYGFFLSEKDLYNALRYKVVFEDSSISDLVDFAMSNNTSYKILRLYNPWLRKSVLNNKNRKGYLFKFPLSVDQSIGEELLPALTSDSLHH